MADRLILAVNCPECGGSGYRWGCNREIECFDCSGEGQWEEEPLCMGCDQPLDANGFCGGCDEYAFTKCQGDPIPADRRAA